MKLDLQVGPDLLGVSGRPPRPNHDFRIDPRRHYPNLPLYDGVLLRRPKKVNKFDFRPSKYEPNKVSNDDFKLLRYPDRRAKTTLGVALLTMMPATTPTRPICLEPSSIPSPPISRARPMSLFGPMQNCIGRALASTALNRLYCPTIPIDERDRHRESISAEEWMQLGRNRFTPEHDNFVVVDNLGNEFNNGKPLQGHDLHELSIEERSMQILKEDIQASMQTKHDKEQKMKVGVVDMGAPIAAQTSDSDSSDRKVGKIVNTQLIQKTLFGYVHSNKYRKVDEMFSQGVDVDCRDVNGNTTLHIACQTGAKKMIKTCLQHGANLNAQNLQGQTPLHHCFAYQYGRIASFLIAKGADDLIMNEFGLTCYEGLRPTQH